MKSVKLSLIDDKLSVGMSLGLKIWEGRAGMGGAKSAPLPPVPPSLLLIKKNDDHLDPAVNKESPLLQQVVMSIVRKKIGSQILARAMSKIKVSFRRRAS